MTAALALSERPSPRKARDADIAWAQHLGRPLNMIPEASAREVRNWKRSISPDAKRILAVVNGGGGRGLVDSYLKKGALSRVRERSFERLTELFAPGIVESRPLGSLGESVLFRWLQPRGPLAAINDEPGFKQDCVVVHCLSIVRFRRTVVSTSMVGLEVPDHCLGRMFERSPGVDPSLVLHAAAAHFMRLDVRQVIEAGRETLVLPAGDGRFLSNVVMGRRSSGGFGLFARPRTYISSSQVWNNQHLLDEASSVERSVLVGGLAMADKFPGVTSPLSPGEVEALERAVEDATA